MRVLVLQSDISENASADDQDSLYAAETVCDALEALGHTVSRAAFPRDEFRFETLLRDCDPEVVFNLVESVDGLGVRAPLAPCLLRKFGVRFTGIDAETMELTCDKPLTKRRLRDAGLPTPDWCEPPEWRELTDGKTYIVKSALEDASVGLDDKAVVRSAEDVKRRAGECARLLGGRWFAEEYVDGREFNIAVIGDGPIPRILPLPEMVFEDWPGERPKIVGYDAKWTEGSAEAIGTVRRFGVEAKEPELASRLRDLVHRTWALFGLRGYARVDFRVSPQGDPTILEINTNPCISPDAGLATAAAEAGMNYQTMIAHILAEASEG